MSNLTPSNRPTNRQSSDAYLPSELPTIEVGGNGLKVEPESLSARDLLDALRRSGGVLLACVISGGMLALLIGWVQTPIYRAQETIELQRSSGSLLNSGDVYPPVHESVTEPYMQTQLKILRSETVLQRVAKKLRLAERSEFRPASRSWLHSHKLAAGDLTAADSERITKILARDISARASGQASVIEILYESPDPQLATDVVNTLAGEFIAHSVERRIQAARRTGESLEKQVSEVRDNLERSENELQRYAASAGLLVTGNNDTVADLRLRQLQDALTKAQEARIGEQARYERARSSPPESLPEVLDDDTLRNYRVKLTDLRRHLAELNATLQPAHYKVKESQAQIAELEAALERGRGQILQRIWNQYLSAQQREKLLSDDYLRQAGLVTKQSESGVRYNMLKRVVDTNRQLYEAMLQKVKEASIASEIRASNMQIIDPAVRPATPVRPDLPLYGAVGLLTGGLFGVGGAVYRKRRFAIRAPGDASLHLHLPELGAIPQADIDYASPLKLIDIFALRGNGSQEAPGGDAAADSEIPELASWRRKRSPIAESFRATLASVLYSERNGRVLAITSACPGEGKTVVATNLAIVLAETKRRVLLVDGDLRRPRLHNVFRIPNISGFADLLRGGSTPAPASGRLAFTTEVPDLHVLPSGPDSANTANLLQSDRAAEVLRNLRQEFDAVVIDTPPLSVVDPRILGQLADGVVLVIRADRTLPDVAAAASRQLLDDGATVLGTILNRWNPKKTSNRYTFSQWQYTYTNYIATTENR